MLILARFLRGVSLHRIFIVAIFLLLITNAQARGPVSMCASLFSFNALLDQDVGTKKMFARLDTASSNKGNILLIHGLLGSGEADMEPLAQKFLKEGYNILRVDLLGHGKSLKKQIQKENSISEEYSLEENIIEIAKIIKKQNFTNAVFIGHSYGGAQAYALSKLLEKTPYRAKNIVLLAPYLRRLDSKSFEQVGLSWLAKPYLDQYMFTRYKEFILSQLNKSERDLSEEDLQDIETRVLAAMAATRGVRHFDMISDYKKWESENRPPILLIRAEDDVLLSPYDFEGFVAEMDNQNYPYVYLTLKNVGHLFPIHNSAQTAKQILKFLTDTETP